MPYRLNSFSLGDMLGCSLGLQATAKDSRTMEAAAQKICEFLYNELTDQDGAPACGLIRCYKTHTFEELPPDLQDFAKSGVGRTTPLERVKCLTLLGSAGDLPAWNSRRQSRGHQAIPLQSREMVERAPMISQLLKEFGVDLEMVLRPAPDMVSNLERQSYGVFHVERALRSPHIPAQEDFVIPRDIRSVVGFGGLLASGDLFAVILFSHSNVGSETANRFKVLALDVKRVLASCSDLPVFSR